jgi:hypothetical protein
MRARGREATDQSQHTQQAEGAQDRNASARDVAHLNQAENDDLRSGGPHARE